MILQPLIACVIFGILSPGVLCQFDDERCKCSCPNPTIVYPGQNLTDRNLYIKNTGRADCKCETVVTGIPDQLKNEYCAKCQCSFQQRNTTTIKIVNSLSAATIIALIIYLIWLKILKCIVSRRRPGHNNYDRQTDEMIDDLHVVVILVICVIGLLVVYLLFLLCLDPMLKQPRKDHPYSRQDNDEDNIFAHSDVRSESINSGGMPSDTRLRRASEAVFNRVEQQQNKWFAKVHEQRRKIFTDHTMLN